MERPSPILALGVNPFPSRFINRTCHFSIFIGSLLYQRAKPSQGTVLFINGKGRLKKLMEMEIDKQESKFCVGGKHERATLEMSAHVFQNFYGGKI